MSNQIPVPRGHCGAIDRGDPETGALYTHCVCGAPYADTIIAAELTRMARTLTAEDDLPDIGRAKPPGITPEAAASVLGYERARAMGATTNVRIDPVDFQADPTGAIRAARERGSVVLTDDDGKPRMRIGAPLRSDTVPDDVRALLTEAKAALEACADGRGPFVCGNATMGGNGEIAGLYALGCHACAATTPDDETDACIAEAVAITVRARAAAKAIGEAIATTPHDPSDQGRHASVDIPAPTTLSTRPPVDLAALVLRTADSQGSVTVTDDAGRPRMVIGGIAPEAAPIETTHVPSYEAGRRDALAKVRAIWQRWMDDDAANDIDALAEIAGLFDGDAPPVLTLDDVTRLANEWTVEHGRKDPLDLDGPAALSAFVGWLRERVGSKQ